MEEDEHSGGNEGSEKLGVRDRKRRERLNALKQRRQSLPPAKRDLGAIMSQGGGANMDAQAGPGGQPGNIVPDFLLKVATGKGQLPPVQRQIFIYLNKILTQLPPQQDDTIPGTSFTYFGVEQLMTLLDERAQDPSAKGAKAAGMALQFLSAHDGEEEVSGASLEKLKMLSKRAEMMQEQRGGMSRMRRGL